MLESSSPGRTLKTTHTAYPATKNGRRNIYARIIKPWQKVEDDTHCIPCYKEWEEKYARISKPWLKVEDYTHCIPRYKECEEKYARIIKPWPKVEDYTHGIPCYKEWEEKYASQQTAVKVVISFPVNPN